MDTFFIINDEMKIRRKKQREANLIILKSYVFIYVYILLKS